MSHFDLDNFTATHHGMDRITRLLFIANATKQKDVKSQVLNAALNCISTDTINTTLYSSTKSALVACDASMDAMHTDWEQETLSNNRQRLEKLESELRTYRNNLIKESIRIGMDELATFHSDTGDYQTAIRIWNKSREFCTNSRTLADANGAILKALVKSGELAMVMSQYGKLEGIAEFAEKKALLNNGLLACMLARLDAGLYGQAADHVLEIDMALWNNEFKDVVSMQDAATVGTLCALSAFTRKKLRSKVLDNTAFRVFLEQEPYLLGLIRDFYTGKIVSVLTTLQAYKDDYVLDMYLSKHVDKLYLRIVQNLIVHYVLPYSCVDVTRMVDAFGGKLGAFQAGENETAVLMELVAGLIRDDRLTYRIDDENNLLVLHHVDEQRRAMKQAERVGKQVTFTIKTMNALIGLREARLQV
jgi:COP9 signalosome complex subunit 1